MKLEQVSEHLNLLSSSNRKQVFDLLFNLGHIYKEFKELLAITHSTTVRRRLEKNKALGLAILGEAKVGSIKFRVGKLLSGDKTILNSHEQHIVFTLVSSPYITPSIREDLKNSLGYELESQKEVETQPCAICNYLSSGELCLSCKRNIVSFTKYRRESFVISVNYLNFNIRGSINIEGVMSLQYKDWQIYKEDTEVHCILGPLPEGLEPIQYELPFVELQRRLS